MLANEYIWVKLKNGPKNGLINQATILSYARSSEFTNLNAKNHGFSGKFNTCKFILNFHAKGNFNIGKIIKTCTSFPRANSYEILQILRRDHEQSYKIL